MLKKNYRKWTDEETTQLLKIYKTKRLVDLGVFFGRDWRQVARKVNALNIRKQPGKFISETRKKMFKSGLFNHKKENHPRWKGGFIPWGGVGQKNYSAVHYWLRYNFSSPDRCENRECKRISNNYTWAKIHGKTYKKDINNFIMLCRSCHTVYDIKNKKYEEK
jgi:hypothetical protein